jgi:4-hydroxy-tetrahydrodipicolinate synthase
VITPLITPLSDRDTLDVVGLENLIEHVISGGVHALFLLGTTGEAAALSSSLSRDLIRLAVRFVDGRVPILAGVCDNSVADSLRLARDVADLGVSAIVLSTPTYLPVEQDEIVRYMRIFNHESPLPIILYNMPRLTKHWFSIDAIRHALELENVFGLKDSSGDMAYFAEVRGLLADRPDWSLLTGPETLLADAVKLGAHGCVGGGSNLWPQLLVDIYEAALEGDSSRLDVLQQTLVEMGKIYQIGGYATGVVRGIKCALEILGVCNGRMADPFKPCTGAQRALVKRQLLKLGLLVGNGRRDGMRATRAKAPPAARPIE